MDPNATWKELLNAYAASDWTSVREFADTLLRWLDRRGFPPNSIGRQELSELNRHIARATCRFVLGKARLQKGGRS